MNDYFLLGMYIGLGIMGVVGIVFGTISLVYFLAKHNILWTLVNEGTAKAVMKFKKFQRIVMAYKGYNLNPETWEVEEAEKDKKFLSRSGLKWVGIPFIYSVYQYEFRWTSFEQAEEKGKLIQKAIVHPGEKIDYILVQDDVYYTFIREAETSGMVPVDVDLLLTIRIMNPYKALFRVQNWLEATQNQLKPVLRSYVSNKTFTELIQRKEGAAREIEELLVGVLELNEKTREEKTQEEQKEQEEQKKISQYLEQHYGVRIKRVGLAIIDPAGERGKAYQEAASKEWEAQKEREKINQLADADVERMDKVYGKITSYKQPGLAIKMMETIEKASEKQGNWFIPFPLENLIKGLISKGGEEK